MTQAATHPDGQVKETLVSIIIAFILAFVFRAFVIEAFIIPTGSMASTLWGDQIKATCPDCGHTFPVTASAGSGPRIEPREVHCQNCGHAFAPTNARDFNSGDRVEWMVDDKGEEHCADVEEDPIEGLYGVRTLLAVPEVVSTL